MKKIKTTVAAVLAATMVLSSSIVAFAGQWQQEGTAWKYQNDDNTYTANGWQWIDGKRYYFDANGYMAANKWIGNYYVGSNGAMLTNTTTPDGYQVGGDGAWIQNQGQKQNDGVHTKTFTDYDANLDVNFNVLEDRTDVNGNQYILIDEHTTTFSFTSSLSNINPSEIVDISFAAYRYSPENNIIYAFSQDGTATYLPFEYDKVYDIQIPETNLRGKELVNYCKQNNIVIAINAYDVNGNALGLMVCYE